MGPRTPRPRAVRAPRLPAACYTRKELPPCYSSVLTGTATLSPGVPLSRCPLSACRRGCVSDCAAHTRGQGHVPFWCCAGSPCGAHMSCSWWAPSIPPVPGLPGSSFRAEGQQERHSLGPSMLYLQLSVGKHGVMFVFLKGGRSGQS